MKKLLLLPALLTVSLLAQTFNVSTTPELRTALTTAATNGEDDTIVLADGTYKTTDDGGGTFIYFSNEGNSLTLQGSSSQNVILSGDSSDAILTHNSTVRPAFMLLQNISFISSIGNAVNSDSQLEVIDCDFSNNEMAINNINQFAYSNYTENIVVKNSTFKNNQGGILISGSDYGAVVDNSIFLNNSGICIYTSSYRADITIDNSTFEQNVVVVSTGAFRAPLRINNSVFIENYSSQGDSVIQHRDGESTVYVSNSLFRNNTSDNTILFSSYAQVLSNNLFIDNNSTIVYIASGETSYIKNNIFFNNSPSDINGGSTVVANIYNNYIDYTTPRNSNNIF